MSGKRYAEEPNSYAFICCAQHAWINACWTEPPVSGGLSPFNRKLFSAERRRKGGLVAGLLYLNRTFALSDEELITRWAENAYWQYFCGETYFQHEPPIHPTSLTHYRQRATRGVGLRGTAATEGR